MALMAGVPTPPGPDQVPPAQLRVTHQDREHVVEHVKAAYAEGRFDKLEFDDRLRADDVLQRKVASLPNVDVVVSARTTEVLGDDRVTGLTYEDRITGESRKVGLDGVFVQIGLLPNSEWLKGTVALSPRGEIEVDAFGRTSLPGVFAAGDVTTVPYKQIVIAMGEGSKAALSAFDHLIRTSAPAERAAEAVAA